MTLPDSVLVKALQLDLKTIRKKELNSEVVLASRWSRFWAGFCDSLMLFIFRKDKRCIHDLIASSQVINIAVTNKDESKNTDND
ncbi:hypothetical protein GGC03_06115 [Vibrio sp. THAF191c]|nr:hypothetical protein FIU99_06100 [Vibrio sp. THAF64]QGM33894.1 hypothetical protein GGC04_06110 [Vibrio sp. THAF191d]QGN69396.1 hypothetical protein GGC03_06115 [Vibrio sp. THAF191c]